MLPLAYAVLLLWLGLGPLLFALLDDRRQAVLTLFVAGFLFLPEVHEYQTHPDALPGLTIPNIALRPFILMKKNSLAYSFLLGLCCFDIRRLLAFRPRWFDLPMLLWCLAPFFSGLANSDTVPGPHGEGVWFWSAVGLALQHSLGWGVPYLAGRLYFSDPDSFQMLAHGLLLGGLAYVPLCLIEKVFSPQLHRWVYGFHAHDFSQTLRGGYRPTVFLEHGLMVALWMVAVSLLASWLWWTRALPAVRLPGALGSLSIGRVALLLVVTTALMNSSGALALGLVGAGVLFLSPVCVQRLLLVGLMLLAPLYITSRIVAAAEQPTGWLDAPFEDRAWEDLEQRLRAKPIFAVKGVTLEEIEQMLTRLFNHERAASMVFRFKQEDMLLEKALQRPWLGWGGEGRARVYDPSTGLDISVTDSLWILTFGDRGLVGVVLLCLAVLLPAARFVWHHPARLWAQPAHAAAAVIALVLVLSLLDDLANAMINSLFLLSSGALASQMAPFSRDAERRAGSIPRCGK